MKKSAVFVAFIISIGMLRAQENTSIIEKGAVFTLGSASVSGYQHIDFPRKNIIMKRGAIVDFKNLAGREVVVEQILSQNGDIQVLLKRKDGLNFFRFYPTVKANLEKALLKGELKNPKSKRKDSLARP